MGTNPIEIIEDVIFTQDWPSQRLSDYEIMAEIMGRWGEYHLHFVWNEENLTLQFFVILIETEVPALKQAEVYTLICLINEQMPLGHFEVFTKIKAPAFRHAFILPGTRTISEALLEEILDLSLEACEKFYPAFQFVIFGDKTPEESVSFSMIDIAGEA